MAFISDIHLSSEIQLLNLATCRAKSQRERTWVAKALVLATPFSMPALVSMVASLIRTIEELSTLQIESVFSPALFAIFRASSVSAVSPLWLMTKNRVFLSSSGSLYLNSLAISTEHLIFANLSKR